MSTDQKGRSLTAGRVGRADSADSILRALDVVGDGWAWLILREAVFHGVRRFGEFHDRLGVPRSTLTARLSQLTRGGVLEQQPATGQDYTLTDSGRDFFGCLMAALRWGDRWRRPAGAPPLVVTHHACGNEMTALLRCAGCGEVLHARDVRAERDDGRGAPTAGDGGGRRRTPDVDLFERQRPCSIAFTLTVSGDWWSSLIIREAFFGVRRFDDLQRHLDIAPNILSGRLRRLVGVGVLDKVQYETWPVRHEYRLTEEGLDFYHVPLALATWGHRWLTAAGGETRLTHVCGREVQAAVTCGACGEPITRDDVHLHASAKVRAVAR